MTLAEILASIAKPPATEGGKVTDTIGTTPAQQTPLDNLAVALQAVQAPQVKKPNVSINSVAPRTGNVGNFNAINQIQGLLQAQNATQNYIPALGALLGKL